MMNFAFNTMDFEVKNEEFVFKRRNFVFKMINLSGSVEELSAVPGGALVSMMAEAHGLDDRSSYM